MTKYKTIQGEKYEIVDKIDFDDPKWKAFSKDLYDKTTPKPSKLDWALSGIASLIFYGSSAVILGYLLYEFIKEAP